MVQSFAPMSAVTHPIHTAQQARRYTPEDLLRLPDDVNYELVDGQLVERTVGTESSWIAARLVALLIAYCDSRALGWVFGADAGFQCFPDAPDKVRKPDVSFVRLDRLPGGPPKGHCRVAPDLAVEVVSPNELYSEVEEKVAEYLSAGVQLVWVIDPPTRSARVHRADGTVANLGAGDELSGESVVPGFHCPVADLFTAPRPPAG
jgi:Uma2 family endonuclease